MSPQARDTYSSSLRDIVFPPAIVQPPIFDANADAAMNQGAADDVIGYELTHGFDDQRRNIDAGYTLFDVKPTEKRHVAPEQHVHIR
ncbi:MAG: M13-type metalloendopeptidase [Dokdonella sp.]